MTRQQFLERFAEVLERKTPLTGAETLIGLEGWGSLAALSFIALADEECGVKVSPKDMLACKTVNDLVGLVGSAFEPAPAPGRP